MNGLRSVAPPLALLAVVAVAASLHLGSRAVSAAPHPNAVAPAEPAAPGANSARIHELDQQIKSMRADFHAQLDPLEVQVKAVRDKFDPQIQSLVDERRTLVEQDKTPAIQDLDKQESAELASIADREKAEIDRVRQRFADERKEVEQKYAERRKDARPAGH